MKLFLAILVILCSIYSAEAAPVIRGIAPNAASPGETLAVHVVMEEMPAVPAAEDISFGSGVRVLSVEKQSYEVRHDRRMLFLTLEIAVEDSAVTGRRSVTISDSVSGPASQFYVQKTPALSFRNLRQSISELLIPLHLIPANLDNDGYDELVAVNLSPFTEGAVDVWHPFENQNQRIYSTSEGMIVSAREAVLADRDNDGVLDLSILNWVQFDVLGGVLVHARNNGDGTFRIVSDRQSRIGDLFIASGDFNSDSYDDLALVGYTGEFLILPGGGKSSFRFKTIPQPFRGEIQNMIAGDVNNDGVDDLVLAIDNEGSGKKEFGIILADGEGAFHPIRRMPLPFAEEGPWNVALSDLNLDGSVEFVFTTSRYRDLVVATFSSGQFQYRPTIRVECNGMAVGDIDSDGDPDVACAGGDVDQLAIFRSAGSSFLSRVTLPAPSYPVSVAIGDWNGDGAQDLATGFGKMYFPYTGKERFGLQFLLQQ